MWRERRDALGAISNFILFYLFIYYFLTGPQGQQCYTLMGFSILYKNSLLLLLLLLNTWEIIVILHACNSGIYQGWKSAVYIMVITIILYMYPK